LHYIFRKFSLGKLYCFAKSSMNPEKWKPTGIRICKTLADN